MKLNISEEERIYLLELIGDKSDKLRKKLLNIRKRKKTTYKKCITDQQNNLRKIEEIVKNNYNLKNIMIYKKLGISKANFYKLYRKKVKELKELYKSQSLF